MNTRDRFADLSGATVTVTGGFGLVGSRIVHKLRALGAKPLSVGRLDAYGSSVCSSVFGISPGDPDVVAGDITDTALMNDLLSRSDYVIHAGALADVAECPRNPAAALEANIRGTQTVLDAAAQHSGTLRRLVFVSSAGVYGVGNGSPDAGACFSEDLAPGQDATTFAFRDQDFDSLAKAAPSLLGQTIFREMRILQRYPQLYLAFEQAKALRAWNYWNHHQIRAPFNGFLPKGEIGVDPAYPADCAVWLAETCERGLIHPVDELDVAFVPRMADLGMTAMRRDATGKAAGHPAAA
ncbi:NAD-dependent epimerase/dehydratase family protein [Streptomyces sp. NPDC051051]|uniref:NAD-dependent epimerase/dehydratase family protein n=1 Tax=Streptomyces sp. NPDC051051 TaxID=3155666 RepID=UPI00341F2DD7